MSFWKQFRKRLFPSTKDRQFRRDIARLTGSYPVNIDLYKLATLHSSVGKISKQGNRVSNERLEFLGDAILSMVIAEFLFKKYPDKNEGFLTEIRSRIVKRDTLNRLAAKIGVPELVEIQDKNHRKRKNSIYGNALEAIIGAVYLDLGYPFCKTFILDKIVRNNLNLKKIIHTDTNYKSKVIEWAQKESRDITFQTVDDTDLTGNKEFEIHLLIDDQQVSMGKGTSKKRAEQDAAFKACQQLKLL